MYVVQNNRPTVFIFSRTMLLPRPSPPNHPCAWVTTILVVYVQKLIDSLPRLTMFHVSIYHTTWCHKPDTQNNTFKYLRALKNVYASALCYLRDFNETLKTPRHPLFLETYWIYSPLVSSWRGYKARGQLYLLNIHRKRMSSVLIHMFLIPSQVCIFHFFFPVKHNSE
jgi:hypothetical protein